MKSRIWALSCGAAIAAISGPAFAAPQSDGRKAEPAPQDQTDPRDVPDIVVTAQKRSERLQDIPAAISAIGEDTIKNVGATRLSDLTAYVPNVTIYGNTKTQEVRIRGVGASSANIGFDARVGVYIDGVYSGTSGGVDQELVDVSRIEVLRGPQGTFFGQNTVAGAINIITKPPTKDLSGQFSVRGGNFGALQIAGRVSGELTDGLTAFVSLNRNKRDGYVLNTRLGTKENNRDVVSWRGGLRYQVSDAFEIGVTVDGLRAREADNHGQLSAFGFVYLNAKPNVIDANTPSLDRRDNLGGAVDATLDLGGGIRARSITAYRDTKSNSFFDADFTNLDIQRLSYADRYRTFSQELQILSPTGGKLDWLIGGYFSRTNARTARFIEAGADGGLIGQAPGTQSRSVATTTAEVWALFGNLTYKFTDRLSANVGARFSFDRKSVDWTEVFGLPPTNQSISVKDFSPAVTLNYKMTPDRLIYLRYAQGYKSPGFNVDFVDPATYPNQISFGKEKARNFELGFKNESLGGRVVINVAAFYTIYNQFQFEQLLPGGGLGIGNAAEVVTKGIEVEMAVRPVRGLTISLNAAYLDAKFTKDIQGFGVFGGVDGKGNSLVRAPELQGAAMIDYVHPVGSRYVARYHVGATYQAQSFSTVDNFRSFGAGLPGGILPEVALVDGRLAFGPSNDRWEIAVWGRNLTNRLYKTQDAVSSLGAFAFGVQFGEPRTYGAELRVRF
ncbi:iron complex outermembrane receptor protein [Sphingomonas sp. UYAg733]